jgi:small subunit ribosomal protein S2
MNIETKTNKDITSGISNLNAGYSENFTVQDLFERNIQYGHSKNLWNPKMAPYIHSTKNNVHIINLVKTFQAIVDAKAELYKAGKAHKRVLFVGTKPQISKLIKKYAIECGQYYVNHKWLGGMLTNWKEINTLVKTFQKYEKQVQKHSTEYTKKELLLRIKEIEKLEKSIGGIKDLSVKPDIIFVIDTEAEKMAIKEANKMGIKVIAVVDTNSNPDGVDLVIPGNDDSIKAIEFYLQQVSDSILRGIKAGLLAPISKPTEKQPEKAGDKKIASGNKNPKFDQTRTIPEKKPNDEKSVPIKPEKSPNKAPNIEPEISTPEVSPEKQPSIQPEASETQN